MTDKRVCVPLVIRGCVSLWLVNLLLIVDVPAVCSELEECLLVMPFDQMVELLQLTDYWLEVLFTTSMNFY